MCANYLFHQDITLPRTRTPEPLKTSDLMWLLPSLIADTYIESFETPVDGAYLTDPTIQIVPT
jgi:hypothetical protein